MENLSFSSFPWDHGERPYFVNEEGFEWYIDKESTTWAKKNNGKTLGLTNVMCFFVKKGNDITRILINDKQQILHEDKLWEGMLCKIDFLKFAMNDETKI